MISSGQSFDAAGADFSALTGLRSLCKTFSFGRVEGADRLLPGVNLIVADLARGNTSSWGGSFGSCLKRLI